MCTDYRQLNQRTIKDSYALFIVDEILDALSGNEYFTVLDMKGDTTKLRYWKVTKKEQLSRQAH